MRSRKNGVYLLVWNSGGRQITKKKSWLIALKLYYLILKWGPAATNWQHNRDILTTIKGDTEVVGEHISKHMTIYTSSRQQYYNYLGSYNVTGTIFILFPLCFGVPTADKKISWAAKYSTKLHIKHGFYRDTDDCNLNHSYCLNISVKKTPT